MREHGYAVTVTWTGDRGEGTASYRSYGRDHSIRADGKRHAIDGSSDRTFHGDADRWNPEELVIAALAQCHMLSYLHVAADAGVVVTGYVDAASGTLETRADSSGALVEAVLRPVVTIAAGSPEVADALHARAAELCFIANSVAFPVRHEPRTVLAG
ncbi:organic hydroperoxide reductase OsmC/OhrA [Microcella putealis]|uniref:Organic hydroperoxide reductase OsmC/OhrA n=1 Tax=Microcella putealis TaxID=337005 RepID=A0A4Q7LY34_9MICO|nr:OsmC family protein [Microcella putealis]RZS59138.1 organic hydroperoxide reductase OsmC/OhrA [Microcella putealis]TQM24164.1 organic hydroperoxide reductase OsmC/OhrA [Microcella putealis]